MTWHLKEQGWACCARPGHSEQHNSHKAYSTGSLGYIFLSFLHTGFFEIAHDLHGNAESVRQPAGSSPARAAWTLRVWPFQQRLQPASRAGMWDCGSSPTHCLHAWPGHVEGPGSLSPPLCPVLVTLVVSKQPLQMIDICVTDICVTDMLRSECRTQQAPGSWHA